MNTQVTLMKIRDREKNYCPSRTYLKSQIHFSEFSTIQATHFTNINEQALQQRNSPPVLLKGSLITYNPHCAISRAHYLQEQKFEPDRDLVIQQMESSNLIRNKLPELSVQSKIPSNQISPRMINNYKSITEKKQLDKQQLSGLLSPELTKSNNYRIQLPKLSKTTWLLIK